MSKPVVNHAQGLHSKNNHHYALFFAVNEDLSLKPPGNPASPLTIANDPRQFQRKLKTSTAEAGTRFAVLLKVAGSVNIVHAVAGPIWPWSGSNLDSARECEATCLNLG